MKSVMYRCCPQVARRVLAKSLGRAPEQLFDIISDKPVAAASLGQVCCCARGCATFSSNMYHVLTTSSVMYGDWVVRSAAACVHAIVLCSVQLWR